MALTEWMSKLLKPVHRFDAFQQRHPVLAGPVAVWRKLSDLKAGHLAALLTFYAFVSVFPLLLVMTTILGEVLRNYPGLQDRLLNSALVDFPVIGDQIRTNIHGLGRSGFGLAVGIIGTVLGAFGLANAAQAVANTIWDVPQDRRPGFVDTWRRNFGLIAVIGLGVLSTTVLAGIGEWAGGTRFGPGVRIALLGASLVATMLLFWLILRMATAPEIHGRDLWLAGILGGVFWQGLQWLGGVVAAHQLRHANALYGVFGIVLGLIAWLYLQARLLLIAVACDVVRVRRAWPRGLFSDGAASSSEL